MYREKPTIIRGMDYHAFIRGINMFGAVLLGLLIINEPLLAKGQYHDPLEAAYEALGGREALESLKSFSLVASGYSGALGEDFYPLDARRVNVFSVTLKYDIEYDRFRLDHERVIDFPFPGERHFSHIVNGPYAYEDGSEGPPPPVFNTGSTDSVRWAAIRKRQLIQNPHLLFKEVLDGKRELDRSRSHDGYRGVRERANKKYITLSLTDSVGPIEVHIDNRSGRISKIAMLDHDVLMCDIVIEVEYSDWRKMDGGIWFPMVVDVFAEGAQVHHEVREQVTVNPELASELFQFPEEPAPVFAFDPDEADLGWRRHNFVQETSAMGVPFQNLQTFIGELDSNPMGFFTHPITIGPGLYFVRGTHNTLVVEQEDGLVIIEAPLYAARAEATLDWLKETFPDKPVKRMVATHHHMDHVGGLRTIVAAGIPIIVGEESLKFYKRDVFGAECTLLPDALERNPVKPDITTISKGGSLLLDDPVNPIMAYRIETSHAADMIILFLPKQGILFNSDLYNSRLPTLPPGLGSHPVFAEELKDALDELAIDVKFFAGGHGSVTTYEEFLEDLAVLRSQNGGNGDDN